MLDHDISVWAEAVVSWVPDLRGGTGICSVCATSSYVGSAGFEPTDPHELVHRLVEAVQAVQEDLVGAYEAQHREESDAASYLLEASAVAHSRWRTYRMHAQTILHRELVAARAQIREQLDAHMEQAFSEFVEDAVAGADEWMSK